MNLLLTAPIGLQALAMVGDEFYFHHRRELPRWERIGHPLDTLTFLACLAWARFLPLSGDALYAYGALAVFSCLFITKDEWVHSERCSPGEAWLHSVLFVLHPVSLIAAALLGRDAADPYARAFLDLQLLAIGGFVVYQFGYWNFLRVAPRGRNSVDAPACVL